MGAAIAQRLIEVGHKVTVWNPLRRQAEAGHRCRRGRGRNAAELARSAEAVISILTDAAAIDAVLSRRLRTLGRRHQRQAVHRDEHGAAAD